MSKDTYAIATKVDELKALCNRLKARLPSTQATQLLIADCLVIDLTEYVPKHSFLAKRLEELRCQHNGITLTTYARQYR